MKIKLDKKRFILLMLFILMSVFTLSACGKKKISSKFAPLVTIQKVKLMNANVYISSPGYFLPYTTASISARASGQIVKIYAHDGNFIRAGKVLAIIDRTKTFYNLKSQKNLINKDKANLFLAKSTLKRDAILYKKELLTPLDYDQAISNYKIAKAVLNSDKSKLEVDRRNYNDTLITSLISGIVSKRYINLGEYTPVNKIAYEIVSLSPLEFEFHVAQSDVALIKNGQKCFAAVKGYPNKIFKGKIYFISPISNPQTRMLRVKALFKNSKLLLRPQFFANVKVKVKKLKDALFVPDASLRVGIKGKFVYIYKNGKAILTKVVTGVTKNGDVQIIKGIAKQNFVIVKGSNLVHTGEQVAEARGRS